MRRLLSTCLITASILATTATYADMTVTLYDTAAATTPKEIGTIVISENKYGLLFTPHLDGLNAGVHGFHVHENPSCGDNGMAAGGHYDPRKTGKHLGPYNDAGHLGDLPALYVNADGTVTVPVLASRLKHLSEIKNHALMIHEGGDNYADIPAKLGGGGARMVCGIVK